MEKDKQNYEEKRCIICNKPYNYKYDLFGRNCLMNLYSQLNISNPRFISNKEKHLCNVIAHRNFKFFLGKNKKYALTENYIALDYLNRMDLKAVENIKPTLRENIKNISVFKRYTEAMLPKYSLNDFYKIYNDYMDFKDLLNKNVQSNNKKIDETILKGFSIIFDINKISMPLYYSVLYEMQYKFWEIVVIGGLLANMKLSAYLMQISLTNSGEYEKEGNILTIEDASITKILFENDEFKECINSLLTDDEVDIKNKLIRFYVGDLLLSLHDVTLNMRATKNENDTWNIDIEIIDKYDFTNFKKLRDYVTSTDSIIMSLLSSTLNDFAAISSSYNVIKPFNFIIKVKKENYKIQNK